MPIFTCISCHVAFKDGDTQREHFQSDWHRYNLKRKVAELPPVTADTFRERVLTLKAKEDEDSVQKSTYCAACKKLFSNTKSFDNHERSKKHIEKAKLKESQEKINPSDSLKKSSTEDEDDEEIEEVDSDEWEEEPIPPTGCLFCPKQSENMEQNIEHMTSIHSFFIPDLDFCVDVCELLTYLGEKVGCMMECLWCGEKGRHFTTVKAVQHHMYQKGHAKFLYEGDGIAEYCRFYNYSSSYPDADKANPDEEVEQFVISDDAYELVLPSGTVIGHKSLLRYYKQYINPSRALALSKQGTQNKAFSKMMSQYRSLGWKEPTKADVARRARDVHFMKRVQAKGHLKLGVKGNKLLQKHFRPQVIF